MIFTSNGSQLLNVTETGDEIRFLWGQDVGPHRDMCYQLRTHDERNGMSDERHLQLTHLMDEVTEGIIRTTWPEVFTDRKELRKWKRTDAGKACSVSRDATPISGDGLQLIIR